MRPKWDVATTSHAGWVFTITTFSDFPIYFWSRPKAINCIAALEHKVDMCWSNRRRSLINMASSFTDLVDSITLLSIDSLYLASLSFLFKTIAWNLSALAIFRFVCTNLQLIQTPVPKFSKVLLKCYKWRWWYYHWQNYISPTF